jgi:hypothetical protein
MRPSHTDPGSKTNKPRSDGWGPDMPGSPRADTQDEDGPGSRADRMAARADGRMADGRMDDRMADDRMADDRMTDGRMADGRMADGYPGDGRAASVAGTGGSWQDIKGRFVDDPAGALQAAENLVQRAVESKVRALQEEAAALCARDQGEDASSTETLRTRLIRYQQYCERLASSR